MKRIAAIVLIGHLCFGLSSANAQGEAPRISLSTSEGYAQRPLTLYQGRMRVDFGPPDFAYMDHGMLNRGRGLNIVRSGEERRQVAGVDVVAKADTQVGLGLGAAYGVMQQLEVGALVVPLALSPDFDYGDMELYGRYAFLEGRYESRYKLAAQLTLQIPTNTDFGLGIGIPALIKLANSMRLDTGVEMEFLFYDDTVVNLDVPVALSYQLNDVFFIGARTGAFALDLKDLDLNLGAFGGVTINDLVDVTASFNWPYFFTTQDRMDTINADWFTITLGGTFYFDISKA